MWSTLARRALARISNHRAAQAERERRADHPACRRMVLESLESRLMLAAALTRPPYLVSNDLQHVQSAPQVAVEPNGAFVAAWVAGVSDYDPIHSITVNHTTILFEQYTAGGLPVTGAPVRVSNTYDNLSDASVAVDSSGNFVVAWTDQEAPASGSGQGVTDVFFQQFNSSGTATGPVTQADTTSAIGVNTIHDNTHVAMASNGQFVVVWDLLTASGQQDTYYRTYNANGTAVSLTDALVNSDGATKTQPDVAMDPANSSFVVTWTETASGVESVYFEELSFSGTVQIARANASTINDGRNSDAATVAMDSRGYFTIAYTHLTSQGIGEIFVAQFDDSGARRDLADLAVAANSSDQELPQVAMSPTQFIVAYQQTGSSGAQTLYNVYQDSGLPAGSTQYFQQNLATSVAATSMDSAGEYAIAVVHPTGVNPEIMALNVRNQLSTPAMYAASALTFLERNSNTPGVADTTFQFMGAAGNMTPISGDWFGSGTATVGLYDPTTSIFYLSGGNADGGAVVHFQFGPANSGWIPIAGDWTGAGNDMVGLYDPVHSVFYLTTTFTGGAAQIVVPFGWAGGNLLPIVGDWLDTSMDTVGLYDPSTSTFFLRDSNTPGPANTTFSFGPGNTGWLPIAGDWTGDHFDTVGLYDPTHGLFYLNNTDTAGPADTILSFGPGGAGWLPLANHFSGTAVSSIGLYAPSSDVFFLKNSNTTGVADQTFSFGPADSTWIPLSGDWTGSGVMGVGLYDPVTSTFYLRNSNSSGSADEVVVFGTPWSGDTPLSGDWTGDGIDTVGLFDPVKSVFYLAKANENTASEFTIAYGAPNAGWEPVTGDWTGSGFDSIGLYAPASSVFFLRNTLTPGVADTMFNYGPANSGWKPISGDWTRQGYDTIGLYNPATSIYYLRNTNTAGVADITFNYGAAGAGWIPLTGDWLGPGGAPELAAGGAITPATPVDPLTNAQLQTTVTEAVALWAAAGAPTDVLAAMAKTEFVITNLSSGYLATTYPGVITIDAGAAGYGWYIDPAPDDDDFTATSVPGTLTAIDPQAVDHIDLLTVVCHELGHIAGLPDIFAPNSGLMDGRLTLGVRRLPTAAEVDAVLAEA